MHLPGKLLDKIAITLTGILDSILRIDTGGRQIVETFFLLSLLREHSAD